MKTFCKCNDCGGVHVKGENAQELLKDYDQLEKENFQAIKLIEHIKTVLSDDTKKLRRKDILKSLDKIIYDCKIMTDLRGRNLSLQRENSELRSQNRGLRRFIKNIHEFAMNFLNHQVFIDSQDKSETINERVVRVFN